MFRLRESWYSLCSSYLGDFVDIYSISHFTAISMHKSWGITLILCFILIVCSDVALAQGDGQRYFQRSDASQPSYTRADSLRGGVTPERAWWDVTHYHLQVAVDVDARSLSGGMRRRLLIAKALVHSPSILILDEPTAGVDIELREMLWEYIFELRSMGTTIILTTHYLEEAQKVCDQIGILNKGTLVEYGETSVLLRQIKNKVLIIQPNKKITKIPNFPSSVMATIRTDGSLQLSFDRSIISTEEVINLCRTDNFSIKDLVTSEPALEDVFRLATKN